MMLRARSFQRSPIETPPPQLPEPVVSATVTRLFPLLQQRSALPRVTAQLSGIWGGRDAGAYPYLDERKRVLAEIQPGLRFEIIPGAGHWVAYEAADRFNPLLAEIAGS